ncbi:MAG: hypothetical protein ACI9N1_000245 [Flavobacteriales bacterium]|jgi:hypothetical protein
MNKNNVVLAFVAVFGLFSVLAFTNSTQPVENPQYEFTSFTVVESIVPNGFGRSRIINALEQRDYMDFTSVQTEEDKSRNKSDRGEIRIENFEETKLLNFFNIGGIRFQNIAANDAVINSKVNTMMNEGWEIIDIVSGVESVGGSDDKNGIFITRFYLKRSK